MLAVPVVTLATPLVVKVLTDPLQTCEHALAPVKDVTALPMKFSEAPP